MCTMGDVSRALVKAADAIEQRASNAGRIIRNPGQTPLCGSTDHDDRYCSTCANMEYGMMVAAEMLRDQARQEATGLTKYEYGIRHVRDGRMHREGMTEDGARSWMNDPEAWGDLDPRRVFEVVRRPLGDWELTGDDG